jgi:protein-S-isoprenylcysteine O-methyltransferase Ste14
VIFGFVYSLFLPLQYGTVWYYLGGLFFLVGMLLYFFAIATIRNASVDTPLSTGPYKYSRHPFYVSMLFIFIGVVMMCLSVIFLLLLAILLTHLVIVIPAEEKFCLQEYGSVYREYMRRTPRWLGIPKK